MNDIIVRLEKIIGNMPARRSRGCSYEEKERYYNLLEAGEDVAAGLFMNLSAHQTLPQRWHQETCRC